jgi:hypothetical protein
MSLILKRYFKALLDYCFEPEPIRILIITRIYIAIGMYVQCVYMFMN